MAPKKRLPITTSCSDLTRFGVTTKKQSIAPDNSIAIIAQTPASCTGTVADSSSATSTSSDGATPTAAAECGTDDDDMETEKEDEEAGTGSDRVIGGTAGELGLNQWRGCTACKAATTHLLTENKTGVHFLDAWINGTVSSPVQKQLCKKFYIHVTVLLTTELWK